MQRLASAAPVHSTACEDPGELGGRCAAAVQALVPTLPAGSIVCLLELKYSAGSSQCVPFLQTATVTLSSAELGNMTYELSAVASETSADSTLRFSCALGGHSTQVFHFQSFLPAATKYECKLKSSEFTAASSVQAAAAAPGSDGTPVAVEIVYEPSNMGDIRDELVVQASAPGGAGSVVYRCALYGHCSPPKPLGPLVMSSGSSASAQFKNVMEQAADFQYTVDKDAFSVAKNSERINGKGSTGISVSFKAPAGASGRTTGKLIVTCPTLKNVSWVYYLHGTS